MKFIYGILVPCCVALLLCVSSPVQATCGDVVEPKDELNTIEPVEAVPKDEPTKKRKER